MYRTCPRYAAPSSELANSTPSSTQFCRSTAPSARYHFVTNPLVSGMPTMAEAGVQGYNASSWYGMLAPTATPRAAIARLSEESAKAAIVQGMRFAIPESWLISVLCVET